MKGMVPCFWLSNDCTTELAALIYACLRNSSFGSIECQRFLCKNRDMLRPLVKNVLRSTLHYEVWLMSLTIGAGTAPCATAFCYCGWMAS
jgi:hypothetical protein